jgi:predicted DNA-binding transcriptional regulator AlpA
MGLCAMDNQSLYMRPQQVCDILHVCRTTLYKLQERGFPAPIKLHPARTGRTLWRRADVIAWMDAQGGRYGR